MSGFTLRAVVIAVGLSLFLLASSMYIAIKLGALPWPIVFSVICAGGLIKLSQRSGDANIHEINTAQAGASIGGLVAAGIAFTLPGILFLDQVEGLEIVWPTPWRLAILCAVSGALGILLSIPVRKTFVEKESLPYPAGTAGAELLLLGKAGGRQLGFIVLVGTLAGAFALFRELALPAGIPLTFLTGLGIFIVLVPLPLAASGGYILGIRAGGSWFLGACMGWLLIVPFLMYFGFDETDARGYVQNLGMGMVLGAGLGFLASYVLPRIKELIQAMKEGSGNLIRLFPILSVFAVFVLWMMDVPIVAAIVAVLATYLMVVVAGRMTGETNINPLEQFGIFVGLVIALGYSFSGSTLEVFAAFMIVIFVSVATAVAGDVGHDFKSAQIVGTDFHNIVKVDLITVVLVGLAAPFMFELIRVGFADTLFTEVMPAPQAQLVAGSIFGFDHPDAFWGGLILALGAEIARQFMPENLRMRIMIMPFGIGLFLGFGLAIPLFIGALIRWWVDKNRPEKYHAGLLLAAGIMGGEGLSGFSLGALVTAGMTQLDSIYILLAVFIGLSVISLFIYRRRNARADKL